MGGLTFLALTSSLTALAQPARGTAALVWEPPAGVDGCRSAADLTTAVERRLGPVFVTRQQADVIIEGAVSRADAGWTAVVTASKPDGTLLGRREIHEATPDCRALDDKIELIVALMIDPEAAAKSQTPLEPVAVKADPPAQPRAVEVPASAVASPTTSTGTAATPPTRWGISVSVGGEAGVGVLPSATPGATVAVGVRPPGFPLFEIGGAVWLAQPATVSPGAASVTLRTAGLSVCPRLWTSGPLELGACGGIQAGEFRARGSGFGQNELAVEPAVGITADADLSVRFLSYGFARLSVGGWLPLIRPRFVYEDPSGNDQYVFEPAPAAFVGTLRVGATF